MSGEFRASDLFEAKKLERVASECDLYGHQYEVRDWEPGATAAYAVTPRVPYEVFCGRCGLSWKVER